MGPLWTSKPATLPKPSLLALVTVACRAEDSTHRCPSLGTHRQFRDASLYRKGR